MTNKEATILVFGTYGLDTYNCNNLYNQLVSMGFLTERDKHKGQIDKEGKFIPFTEHILVEFDKLLILCYYLTSLEKRS